MDSSMGLFLYFTLPDANCIPSARAPIPETSSQGVIRDDKMQGTCRMRNGSRIPVRNNPSEKIVWRTVQTGQR
ncbi:hypothetical protein GCM10023116_08660 [Kistimonas scapharcae]|uniref:Uncharacterized protein n=1 Tax=Kistimonas scapharcae TaxID=1036133 RepID=A0ABP8UYA8_9GAMM